MFLSPTDLKNKIKNYSGIQSLKQFESRSGLALCSMVSFGSKMFENISIVGKSRLLQGRVMCI